MPMDKKYPPLDRTQCTPIAKPQPMERKKSNTSKPKNKGPDRPEKEFQGECDAYLDLIGASYIRIPDILFTWVYGSRGSKTPCPEWIKKLIGKYIAGLPDLMIIKKTDKGVMMLSIELKASKGVISPKQKKWARVLDTHFIYDDFEEFKQLVDSFLKENER